MAEIIFELVEAVLVAIFLGLGWTSSLSFLVIGSPNYWVVCGLTTAYLVLLLVKIVYKGFRAMKAESNRQAQISN